MRSGQRPQTPVGRTAEGRHQVTLTQVGSGYGLDTQRLGKAGSAILQERSSAGPHPSVHESTTRKARGQAGGNPGRGREVENATGETRGDSASMSSICCRPPSSLTPLMMRGTACSGLRDAPASHAD